MTTKQQVLALAKEKGFEVDDTAGWRYFTVELVAPDGFRFRKFGGIHGLVSEGFAADGRSDSKLAWRMALSDAKQANLERCPADCVCKE